MIKNTFSDTILVAILSYVIHLSDVRDWVAISVGAVSFIWIAYQLISKIREDINRKK